MNCLRFGVYRSNGECFDVGSTPRLDCIDGFFDQALDGRAQGEQIQFVIDHECTPERPEQLLRWHGELPGQALLSARLLEAGRESTRVQILRSQPFREVLEDKRPSGQREALEQIQAYDSIWEARRAFKGPNRSYVLRCGLPCSKLLAPRRDDPRPRVQLDTILRRSGPDGARVMAALAVEPIGDSPALRVFVPGDNHPESFVIFDITDPSAYQRALTQRLEGARSPDERAFWAYLLT